MRIGRKTPFKNAYIWWVSVFLIIIVVSFKYPIGQQFNLILAPVLHVVQAPARWYKDFSLWFASSQDLHRRYLDLQRTTAKQQAKALETEILRTENKQLRQLLKIPQIQGYIWRVASVVSRGPEQKSRSLMIAIKQAEQDDVLVSHEGLVGLIASTNGSHAMVRTILDASVTVPVTMKANSLAALVRGDGQHLQVDFVPLKKAPGVGDVLVTSGAGGVFPAGLPVAEVVTVKPVPGGVFAEVQAIPVASWQRDAWLAVVHRTDETQGTLGK